MSKKNDIKQNESLISLNEVEVRALMVIVEKFITDSSNLKDIKGLCIVHNKLQDSLAEFIPF